MMMVGSSRSSAAGVAGDESVELTAEDGTGSDDEMVISARALELAAEVDAAWSTDGIDEVHPAVSAIAPNKVPNLFHGFMDRS